MSDTPRTDELCVPAYGIQEINKLIFHARQLERELNEKFPNIGPDPLKANGEERKKLYNQTRERLSQACSVQQKGVPDQTALVWRIDLDRTNCDLIIAESRLNSLRQQNAKFVEALNVCQAESELLWQANDLQDHHRQRVARISDSCFQVLKHWNFGETQAIIDEALKL